MSCRYHNPRVIGRTDGRTFGFMRNELYDVRDYSFYAARVMGRNVAFGVMPHEL